MTTTTSVLSRRASTVRPLALAALLATLPERGALDLALGIPPGGPPRAVVDAAVRALRDGRHQYVDASGQADLRRAVADQLLHRRGVEVDPATEVTVTCGSTEAAAAVLTAVTDPGDEVLVPEPFFENHPGAVQLAGAVPRYVPLSRPGWRIDPGAVRAAVTPRTRAVLFSSPHNPTGRVFDRRELEGLLDVCEEFGLVCITDEVYERYVHVDRSHVSPLELGGRAHRAVLGSLSKSLQVSGWRIGYCVAGAELTEGVRRVHTRTTLGAATPLQVAATAGLAGDHGVDPAVLAAFRERRDQVVTGLRELGLEVEAPDGGWFVLAGLGSTGLRSDELVPRLAREAGVLLAPGSAFFDDPADGVGYVRVSLVRDRADTQEALARLRRFLGSS